MKFGGIHLMQVPRPWTPESGRTLLNNALALAELSDQCGFDYVWGTEHHFLEEYSHASAPEIFLAACSQRTKHVRLAHGIIQTPPNINHPARVAERIACLDLISNGRCEFGMGSGATTTELGGFLVPQDDKKAMQIEGMRVAVRMLVEEPFTGFEGKYVTVPPRNLVPKPLQKPHPPLWMACSRRESILDAARLGLGALTFSFVSPDEARHWVKDYYATIENDCEPLGYAVNPNFAIATPFLCDHDEKRVSAAAVENYGFFVYGLGHYSFFGEHRPGKTDIWHEYTTNPKEPVSPEFVAQACVGSPQKLRHTLREYEDAGIDQVIAVRQVGRLSLDLQLTSLQLFSDDVLPEFKERELAGERRRAERCALISEKAMARKPKSDHRKVEISIPAAGRH
ncbi:MAG TPA: LLM class flavin-dependent oxidoreductase [Candidatus Acidoferrales bacterium]|nr:LLM class flavin-dependent oxidoreductase [Candidatus Acidoferrales bacterium]